MGASMTRHIRLGHISTQRNSCRSSSVCHLTVEPAEFWHHEVLDISINHTTILFPSTRPYSFHLHLYPMNLATPSFSSIKSGSGGRSGGGDGFLFVNPSKRSFAKSKILTFSMIFYELIPGYFLSSCSIFVPFSLPQTPKQRGILTDGVGYE